MTQKNAAFQPQPGKLRYFMGGFLYSVVWTGVWLYALDTPLKALLVPLRDYGLGKHGYLIGAAPVLLLCVSLLAKKRVSTAVSFVAGAAISMFVCFFLFMYMALSGLPAVRTGLLSNYEVRLHSMVWRAAPPFRIGNQSAVLSLKP